MNISTYILFGLNILLDLSIQSASNILQMLGDFDAVVFFTRIQGYCLVNFCALERMNTHRKKMSLCWGQVFAIESLCVNDFN